MEDGDLVLINYVGRKDDGSVFDLTVEEKAKEEGIYSEDVDYSPIPVLIGGNYVIEGLEKRLKDMDVGDEKEFEVSSEEAYGKRETDKIETYPEREFNKQGVNVRPGEEIMIGRRRGKVISKSSGRVRVDFNHPLAGQDLNYWVSIEEKIEDDEEIAEQIYDFRVGHGDIEFEGQNVNIIHKHEDDEHSHKLPEELKEKIRQEILDHTEFEEVNFEE